MLTYSQDFITLENILTVKSNEFRSLWLTEQLNKELLIGNNRLYNIGGNVMVQRLFYVLIVLAVFTITGCSNGGGTTKVTIDSIDAEEVLKLDADADIFQYDRVIYQTNINWVKELSLTKDVQIGEIKTRNDANTDFKDEMSNKLPVGAKIVRAKNISIGIISISRSD